MTGVTDEQLDTLCQGLASPQARTKYGSSRRLLSLSEQDPAALYPRLDFFAHMMEGDKRILRWNARRILRNLARVDSEGSIDKLLPLYLSPITGHEMIGAANAMEGAAEIAIAKPYLADRIAAGILKVSRAEYATPECNNVAAGHAIKALDRMFEHIQKKAPVLAFVQSQLGNPRPATRRKAEKFWRKRAGG